MKLLESRTSFVNTISCKALEFKLIIMLKQLKN